MSQLKLASRLDPIKPSITLAVTAKAAKLKAAGIDVISFGAGEPDFDPPSHIKEAVREALERPQGGFGKYTDVGGILPLRKAIAAELGAVHKVTLDPDQVLVSTGAKHSLYNLFMALLDPGDEVLIPAPYWVSYPDMVMLAEGRPVILPTRADDDFAVTAAAVRAACTARTRAIVLNNPSNPTGAVYTRAQIEALAKVVVEKDLLVISDDIYRQLVYGDAEYVSIAAVSPEVAKRTILVDGVSKTYAMTGWRIGYTAGPKAFRMQFYGVGNAVVDDRRQEWANFGEAGFGLRISGSFLPESMYFTVDALRGRYFLSPAYFHDLRAGFWYAFTR